MLSHMKGNPTKASSNSVDDIPTGSATSYSDTRTTIGET